MGESGGSAERMAQLLAARGDDSAAAWAAGAEGERRVAAALATLPADYLVLHDRLLMPGVTESNLDHLVVGPTGILLVDAKNWSGQVTEYGGTLFQHYWSATGERTHRPRTRELARVEWMAGVVAGRLRHGVTQAICLVGRDARRFGEPRVVRGVWIVPLPHLARWVTGLRRAPEAELQALKVQVRTEFPSTTTDPLLLAAIGRDLGASRSAPHRRPPTRRPVTTARRPVTTAPPPTRRQLGDARRAAERRRRHRRLRRRAAALVLLASAWLSVSSGAWEDWARTAGAQWGQHVAPQPSPTAELTRTSSTTAPPG
ncbi:nuclease-related domain-containing protein [Phycicoccus sonneratiae]|uniref:NERD domain-containing protein n=1 Tax=Phycicoccus sonneratiae TaxID=2807628 RepID=A0ABS2CKC9_9MICO|nr:nuclease-related domain-containing protein [Phycicoccus sonneraticus]MBM6400260.1 NERD domain-containing protein [Phycicoccus sonneraticus]